MTSSIPCCILNGNVPAISQFRRRDEAALYTEETRANSHIIWVLPGWLAHLQLFKRRVTCSLTTNGLGWDKPTIDVPYFSINAKLSAGLRTAHLSILMVWSGFNKPRAGWPGATTHSSGGQYTGTPLEPTLTTGRLGCFSGLLKAVN